MRKIKGLFDMIFVTAVTTLTACKVKDLYDKYTHNEIAKAGLKRKFKKLNPFKRKRTKESE